MRLGLYVDAPYRRDGDRVLTNFETYPFLQFGCEVGTHFDELVLFGREAPEGAGVEHALPGHPRLALLPWYTDLASLGGVARALTGTARGLWRGLDEVDVVWAFGPHPFSLLLAVLALVRRRRVVLGVRQDTMTYFRHRLRSKRAAALLGPLWIMDALWRLLARRVPTAVVGDVVEGKYGGPRPGVLRMTVSLVRSEQVADEPPRTEVRAEPQLLTVGRLDWEKNPVVAVEALARLSADGGPRARLTWVGTGRLKDDVRAAAERLGVSDRVDLPGFVPIGPELLARYRDADLFVHVAVTEGTPQVLLEALSTGLPIVATDVGGVATALEDGAAGLLVAPRDPEALAAAVQRALADDEGRLARARRGLAIAREHAMDVEAARVARWIRRTRA
jgi:glycosyltransferase involved in cell wall biosynthesis